MAELVNIYMVCYFCSALCCCAEMALTVDTVDAVRFGPLKTEMLFLTQHFVMK